MALINCELLGISLDTVETETACVTFVRLRTVVVDDDRCIYFFLFLVGRGK